MDFEDDGLPIVGEVKEEGDGDEEEEEEEEEEVGSERRVRASGSHELRDEVDLLKVRLAHMHAALPDLEEAVETEASKYAIEALQKHRDVIATVEKQCVELIELADSLDRNELLSLAAIARRRKEEQMKARAKAIELENRKIELKRKQELKRRALREAHRAHGRSGAMTLKSSEGNAAVVLLGRKLPVPPGVDTLDLSDVYDDRLDAEEAPELDEEEGEKEGGKGEEGAE